MYSLSLSAEQIGFRDTAREFVTRELKPTANHPDRLQRLRPPFPRDLLARTAPLGLRTLLLSEDCGGAGADTLSACIVLEELATGDVDVTMALAHTIALVPTIAEAGVPGFDLINWYGPFGPAATPRQIVNALHRVIAQELNAAEVQAAFSKDGAEATPSASPEAFGALLAKEVKSWEKLVKLRGFAEHLRQNTRDWRLVWKRDTVADRPKAGPPRLARSLSMSTHCPLRSCHAT